MLQTPVSILVGFSAVHHVLGAMDNNNNKKENTLTSNYVCKFRNSFIGTLFPDTKVDFAVFLWAWIHGSNQYVLDIWGCIYELTRLVYE